MKSLVTAIALLAASSMANAAEYDCGVIKGHSIQVAAGPILVVDGVNVGLQAYNQGSFGTDYVSADGQYVWSVRSSTTRLYDAKPELLASCSTVSSYRGGGAPRVEPYDPNYEVPREGAYPWGNFFP